VQRGKKIQRKASDEKQLEHLGGRTDFMQTQTFHRRNLSNLIKTSESEEVPDHLIISRGGPLRRTLEQIEQGSNYAYGEESVNEMMNSQESAEENGF